MKKELKTWLGSNDRDYAKGVELFTGLKIDVKKNAFFTTDEPTEMHSNMLFQQLANYDRVYNKVEKVIELPNTKVGSNASATLKEALSEAAGIAKMAESGRVRIEKENRIKYEDLIPEHKAMFDENGKMYGEIKSLHAKLKALPEDASNDEERKSVLDEMLAKQKVIRTNWDALDAAYPADGSKPETKDAVQPTEPTGAITKAEIEQITNDVIREKSKDMRIDANINYLRRNQKDAKKAAKVQERIDELTAWGVDYESRIGKN